MKYRTKLYLAFTCLILGTILLVEGLTYLETRRGFVQELRDKVLGVAVTTSQLLNENQVDVIRKEQNDKTETFASVISELRQVRDTNRKNNIYIKYIYLIQPDPKNPKQIVVVADAEEDEKFYAPPGTVYPEGIKIGIMDHLQQPFVPSQIVQDRWGKFLPGYAPIYSADGKYLATVGVNLSAEYVDEALNRLKWIAFMAMGFSLAAGLIVATFLANGITRSLIKICNGISHIGHGEWQTRIEVRSADEFGDLALAINSMALGLEERERLKLNFVRYVSKHVMEKILTTNKAPVLEGERRKITVLFSDIRDFTRLAEHLSPEKVVSLLNEYLATMLDVIFAHNGTLDKFIGDGLMVEFGAPLDDLEQEIHAIQTALAMNQELTKLNQKWASQLRPQISIGIGIHTGFAIVGNIGSEKRMEYTAIGDTVNVASRLEEATKQLKVPILISETTWSATDNRYDGKPLGPLTLKGRADPINVYSIDPREKLNDVKNKS